MDFPEFCPLVDQIMLHERCSKKTPCSFGVTLKRFLSVMGQGQGMRHMFVDIVVDGRNSKRSLLILQ